MISIDTSTAPTPDSAERIFFLSACLCVLLFFLGTITASPGTSNFLAFSLAMLLSILNFRGWKLIVLTLGKGRAGSEQRGLQQAFRLLLGFHLKILSLIVGFVFLLKSDNPEQLTFLFGIATYVLVGTLALVLRQGVPLPSFMAKNRNKNNN